MFMDQDKSRLVKAVTVLVLIGTAFGIVATVNAVREGKYIGAVPPQNTITVSGEGEVFATADIATFTFGVTTDAKTVKDAQDAVSKKIDASLSYLKKAGVADKDIKTLAYNIYPKYSYGPLMGMPCSPEYCPPSGGKQTLVGYTVSQQISVKVRDTEKAGEILGGLGNLGVTDISGIELSIDDATALQREARKKAITDATTKADQLADDLDVHIIRLVSFSENGNYPVYYKTMAADSGKGGGEVAPMPSIPKGENKITSNVTITYEIR